MSETTEQKTETTPEITLEAVETFLTANEEGKKFLQSKLDNSVTKGINTYKQNFLEKEFPTLLETEVNKRLPQPETPELKRLREIELKLEAAEKDKVRSGYETKLLKIANEKKLPDFLVPYSISDTEEKSVENFNTLSKRYTENVNSEVEKRLAGTGRPVGGTGHDGNTSTITLDSIKGMSKADLEKNKDAIEALLRKQ